MYKRWIRSKKARASILFTQRINAANKKCSDGLRDLLIGYIPDDACLFLTSRQIADFALCLFDVYHKGVRWGEEM